MTAENLHVYFLPIHSVLSPIGATLLENAMPSSIRLIQES
jgi:hypothetical protein